MRWRSERSGATALTIARWGVPLVQRMCEPCAKAETEAEGEAEGSPDLCPECAGLVQRTPTRDSGLALAPGHLGRVLGRLGGGGVPIAPAVRADFERRWTSASGLGWRRDGGHAGADLDGASSRCAAAHPPFALSRSLSGRGPTTESWPIAMHRSCGGRWPDLRISSVG